MVSPLPSLNEHGPPTSSPTKRSPITKDGKESPQLEPSPKMTTHHSSTKFEPRFQVYSTIEGQPSKGTVLVLASTSLSEFYSGLKPYSYLVYVSYPLQYYLFYEFLNVGSPYPSPYSPLLFSPFFSP